MPTDEERLEQLLADGNHVKAKRRGVEERFGMLRALAGLWVLLGLAPWACVALVATGQVDNVVGWGQTRQLVTLGFGVVAVFSTVAGLALSELLQLAVSVEHTLRVIAARLKTPTRTE